jgi:hypothetical protein
VSNGSGSDVDEIRALAQVAATSAGDAATSARVAADRATEAANSAAALSTTAERTISATEILIISVVALGATLLAVISARNSASGGPPVFDLVAIVTVGLAIALVAVGVGGIVWSDEDRPDQNYIERELIANRAKRASMVGLAFVLIGALLLTTTLVMTGVKATNDAKATPSASSAPGPSPS